MDFNYERFDMRTPQNLGTTIIGASFDGGVVIASDTLATTGTYIAVKESQKLTQISDNIFVCRSGVASMSQMLLNYVRNYIEQHNLELEEEISVKSAAKLTQQIVYQNKDFLQVGLIVAGYDQNEKGSLYSLPLGGSNVSVPFIAGGSGSVFIQSWMDRNWKENMTRDECKDYVLHAAVHAMSRDKASGGNVRLIIIDENGPEKHYIRGNELPVVQDELPQPYI